jgi:ribosomal protein S18 acetylase RimI-like enzyme
MVTLTQTLPEHFLSIKSIAERTLGEGYVKEGQIPQVALTAELDGKIVGYGTGFIGYPYNLGTERETLFKLYQKEAGIIGNVATDPDYQRRGIGHTITAGLISELRKLGAELIVASAWKSNKGVNIGGVFAKLGFKTVTEIPSFWKGVPCIQCDPKECNCSAVIFELSQV